MPPGGKQLIITDPIYASGCSDVLPPIVIEHHILDEIAVPEC